MKSDELFELGYVEKIHGLNGEIVIYLDVDFPEEYKKMESVFLELEGKPIPFFLNKVSIQGKRARVKIEEVNSRDEAERLRSCKALLPLSFLPELKKDQFYYHEIIGFTLKDNSNEQVGIITDVFEMPGDDLISADREGKEILVPINDQTFIALNKVEKEIQMNIPEGLLAIYLE